ncbi:hypothetical protein P154DRAFT_564016 [Amniculicola lignicola CBS 123094]|uniref:SPT2-domain-containing protein n=1 Tax=Amniculicola lignicola CBS 123094 TaxID=1392246 RepID=A0A6A5WF05_9PLEO|nr:hypothetical protein P154DRAFT_564016 [Amniculicola lignicola CBS 123094]
MGSKLLNNLLQEVTGTPPQPAITVPRPTQSASAPRPAPRPATTGNVPAPGPLKRKAEGPPDGSQVKVQRREAPAHSAPPNGATRAAPRPDAAKPKTTTTTNGVPYRGTAGLGGPAKPSPVLLKKPVNPGGVTSSMAKSGTPLSKPGTIGTRPSSAPPKTAAPPPASGAPQKKTGYAAMLARAKEAQQSKPVAAQAKAEPTRILTKKERLALRAEAAQAAKGKKGASAIQARAGAGDAKGGLNKEKREPSKLTYQGTARPVNKPPEAGYKGTARPASTAAGPGGKTSVLGRSNPKPKAGAGRYDGYRDWSDLSDAEDGEDYPSEEEESDMEGGLWDMEEEEEKALRVAKKEDAEALREENEHKKQKEERKRKLLALSKAASAKKKR